MSWTFCRRRGEGRPIVTQQPTEDVALEFETPTTADRCCARQQRLSRSDLDLVRTKRSDANRLGFAVLLLHFRKHGFPEQSPSWSPGSRPT